MAPVFVIPSNLRDLEGSVDNGERLCAQEATDVETLSAYEVDELVKGVAYELAESEVWSIDEQNIFDRVYSLVRGYAFLEPSARGTVVESLCSNFSVLNPSISTISHASSESSEDAAYMLQQMHSHRNALKIYSYFLHCILVVEEAADSEQVSKAPSGKGKKVQPRKPHVPAKWSWDVHRTRIVRLFSTALQVNLRQLYSMSQPETNLIAFFAEAAFSLLKNPAHVKEKDLKDALCNMVAACAVKYDYIVPVTSTILNLLHKYEHLSVHLAELVALTEEKYHNSSLPVAVLREIGHINSDDFKRDNSGAESVSSFLVSMAERMPKLMTVNLSIITPHLDGESYKMRNGIVQVIGTLILKTSKPSDDAAGDEMARLRSKQSMVDILLERVRDKSSYTRSKVLQTWGTLCEGSAVSIGHWNIVTKIAAGRLEDKAAIVRKSALQLLTTLLQFNPFGPSLRVKPFEATLQHYKEKLRQIESTTDKTGDHLAESEDDVRVGRNSASQEENSSVVNGAPDTQRDELDPSQIQPEVQTPRAATEIGGLERTRTIVASLESGLQFARCIAGVMDVFQQLLASSSSDDVKHTITLLILARQFEVDGAEASLQKMLPLVFSQEKSVYEAVEVAFISLYMKRSPSETALNLLTLALNATIGDLASIEALLIKFTAKGDISHGTVAALWNFFTYNALDVTPEKSRGALVILCMAAKSQPQIIISHLQSVIDVGLGRRAREDPLLARYACIALQRLCDADRIILGSNHQIFGILSSLIIKPGIPEEGWYSAAEQAINTIYALHPTPEKFVSGLLSKFCRSIFGISSKAAGDPSSPGELTTPGSGVPGSAASLDSSGLGPRASFLSRFLFALAHIALKHLVYVESCVRKLRKQKADKEKAAADAAADLNASIGGSPSQQASNKAQAESIDAELGLAAGEDARIDSLLERIESEIISGASNKKFLIGAMAPIVAKICRNLGLMQQYPGLRSSAMLALCKLMAIDADFCDQNLQLLFTVAQNSGESAVRSNCTIALGDLAFRFPNVLEPWTEHMYARLNDKDRKVRKNAVLVLTHLILNDMVKVKGHISEMVLRLEDEDERIQNLVKLFFHELSNKANNPIYNLFPDILSRLSSHDDLPQDTFRSVMQFLLNSITKDKQKEGLFEKLCHRFPGTSDPKQWKDLSYCLAQLTYTDKSLKKMIELFPKYQNALGDDEVVEHFRSIVTKAKKFAKPEMKSMADEFETKVAKFHEEKKEHDLAVQNAQAHQNRPDECRDGAHTQNDGHNMGGQIFEEECEASKTNDGTAYAGDERNGETFIAEDEAAEAGIDHRQAQVFSEAEASEEGIKQGNVDSHDLHAATNDEESNSGPKVSGITTKSPETGAVMDDRMSDEDSDSTSDRREMGSNAAISAVNKEDECKNGARKQQSPGSLQYVHPKRSSRTRLSHSKGDGSPGDNQTLREDYRSQRFTGNEAMTPKSTPNAEAKGSHNVPISSSEQTEKTSDLKHVGNGRVKVERRTPSSTIQLRSTVKTTGRSRVRDDDDVVEHPEDSSNKLRRPRPRKVVHEQPTLVINLSDSDDDQSQLSDQYTGTAKKDLKPILTRQTRRRSAQAS